MAESSEKKIDFQSYGLTPVDENKLMENENTPNFQSYGLSPIQQQKVEEKKEPEMVDTFLGKMPKRIAKLESGTPENEKFINDMIDAAAGGPGIKTIVQAPFKLTLKNIANKVIEAKNKEKLFHDIQYKKIWDSARQAGINNVNFDRNILNLNKFKNAGGKYTDSIKNFIANPSLENAQKAQSDLGKLVNSKELTKDVLTSKEKSLKESAENAQKHIRDRMFRDVQGNVNKQLKDQYDKITKSYGENYKPYDIKNVKLYEKGKRTAKQLVESLKTGSFMAEKGHLHPEIDRRKLALDSLKYFGLPATGTGAAFYIMNKLLNRSD